MEPLWLHLCAGSACVRPSVSLATSDAEELVHGKEAGRNERRAVTCRVGFVSQVACAQHGVAQL